MKKYLFIILILITFNLSALCAVSTKDTLSSIENNLFGYEYKNESETKRIERIEDHIYGEKRSGNIQKRLENIQADTGFIVQEEKPPVNTNVQNNQNQQTAKNNEVQNLKEDSTVDYPIVDKMEEEIFKTTYKKENIYSRLDRLEERVFKQKSNADLNTRVYKLAEVLSPVTAKQDTYQDTYQNTYTAKQLDDYYSSNGFEPVNNQTLPYQLVALEEALFRKSFDGDNNADRLSRLEQKLFNRTFPTDADTERMQRIKVAYDAKQNSYKYENNRKMQNMATMSQLGGILLMILAILL